MSQGDLYFAKQRAAYHAAIRASILSIDGDGVPSNADKHNDVSKRIAAGIAGKMGEARTAVRLAGQRSGHQFERLTAAYLEKTFRSLCHIRPGKWSVSHIGGRDRNAIARYYQFDHLIALEEAAAGNPQLAAALGSDYTITPDIVVAREPELDADINRDRQLIAPPLAALTGLRKANNPLPLLHASISCKWTIRSDRVQNARSEALNLLKNRKGHAPHAVVVTGEPLPSRIAAIALGTGEIDCVYHIALLELTQAIGEEKLSDAEELVRIMVEGKRLKDISDLPFDLAV